MQNSDCQLQSKGMMLPPGWYVVLESSEVVSKKPLAFTRFGLPLVAWRNSENKVVVQSNICPHRGAKLSLGSIKNGRIVCPFHGFEFSQDGHCAFLPEIQKPAPGLKIKRYETFEFAGWIWLKWRDEECQQLKPTWFKQAPEKLYTYRFSELWPVHFTRSVENQLDFSHLPFVHRTSIGRFSKAGQYPKTDMSETGIKFYFGDPEKSFVEMLFPNIWINYISPKYMLSLAFAPVDDNHTKLYLQGHRAHLTWPPFSWLANAFDRAINKWVLSQDRKVVTSQEPQNSLLASETLMKSDELIRHFRKWLLAK